MSRFAARASDREIEAGTQFMPGFDEHGLISCIIVDAGDGEVLMFAHMNDPVPSVRKEVDDVPDQLDSLISKTMAKRPEDRYPTASELLADLERVAIAHDKKGS